MQTKREKREGAISRLQSSKWEDAKSNRLGTKTQEQWQNWKEDHLDFLSKKL